MTTSHEEDSELSGGLETLEEEITCPVCQEHFDDPKILPCCHYYCRDCIQLMVDKAGPDQPFSCPECRKETRLPKGGADNFPAAFFVNRMKSAYMQMEKAHKKVEALCEMCSGGKVEAFCRQCTDFICTDCVRSHAKLKVFSGHCVVTLDELKEGGTKHLRASADATTLTCKDHEEPLKIFCFDCNCLVCRDCILIDHAGHKYEFVKKSAAQCRAALRERIAPLQEFQSSVARTAAEIETTRSEISFQGNTIAKTIKTSFRELSEVLGRQESELLNKTSSLVDHKLQALGAQQKALKLVESEVQSVLDLVRRSSLDASDEEVMTVQKNLLARVEEERQKCEKVELEIMEDANLTVSVLPTKTVDSLCREEMAVNLLSVDPTKCSVDTSEFSNAEVGKTLSFHVRSTYSNGMPSGGRLKIDAELKSLDTAFHSSPVHMSGVYKSKGVYTVTCTPEIRGRHQLSVTVDSKPISGSPFDCFVRIPPAKLGRSSRSIEGMKKPWGVAVTNNNTILVTDWKSNRVSVFGRRGQRMEAIATNCFYAPTGIAVNEQGHIFVADGSNAIFKLTPSGKLLKSVTYKDFEFSEPTDVMVGANGHVYICDRGNHRITIFTDELVFIRSVGKRGTGLGEFILPESIAQDPRTGNLYISDYDNHRIHTMTPDKRFLNTFGEDHLESPNGLCIDSVGNLYVADFRKGCIVVFSVPSCKFITMFCLPGPEESNPSGLAVDSDGYLYVCDFFNRRVVVF